MGKNSNQIDIKLLKRVLKLALPYKKVYVISLILTVIIAPISILRPHLVMVAVDDYILKLNGDGLLFIVGLIGLVLVVEAIIRYAFIYYVSLLGQLVIRDLRVRVFQHISKLRLTYFDNTPIGTSITRTTSDIETINTVFSQGVITIISDILGILAVLIVMFYTSWQLTLVCLIPFPFLIIATYIFKEKVKAAYQIVRTQISMMNAFLQERISGMRIVQIFNVEKEELDKFKAINRKYTQANLNTIFYYALFFPTVEIISATALGLMVWWGTRGVISGYVTPGMLIAFPIYLGMLFRPARMLADKFNSLQMGLVAAQRIYDILDTDTVIKNNGKLCPERLKGHVRFDKVDFSYNQDKKVDENDLILKQVSFEIQAGKTLAIIGSTGSGKSTIVNVLSRFYEIQSGEIQIDNMPIQDYELHNFRKRIAVVLQDVFLFSGSVIENITLRNTNISRDKVISSSKMIGADEFIMKLPNGYDYKVMERGAALSVGQRQLISFVRALVFEPDILILDEATSSIDPETESVIQFAIETLVKKSTSIIIAHRLATIRHADNVMVMDNGKAIEFGNHKDLINIKDGKYKSLYEMQFLKGKSKPSKE